MPGLHLNPDLHLNPALIVVADVEGYLACDLDSGRLTHLNGTAALVVELIDEGCSLDQVQQALAPILAEVGWQASLLSWVGASVRDGLLCEGLPTRSNLVKWDPARLRARASELRDSDCVLAAYVCQLRSLELAPDDPRAWYRLAELAHILGRRDAAREAYARYFAEHPDDAEVELMLVALGDGPPPARVTDRCIRQMYAEFSSYYEANMVGDLEYRGPQLVHDAIARAGGCGERPLVLDLGCGSGLCGEAFRARTGRRVGVDLSPEMIERAAARRLYDALHEAEITAFLASPSCGRFDLIVACDVLIYFGDLCEVLRLAAQRLTPGGLLAFTVERSGQAPHRLTDAGRFAHHHSHLLAAAKAAGLTVDAAHEAVLRREYGQPVTALVTVCRSTLQR